jgi:hypothetical protein
MARGRERPLSWQDRIPSFLCLPAVHLVWFWFVWVGKRLADGVESRKMVSFYQVSLGSKCNHKNPHPVRSFSEDKNGMSDKNSLVVGLSQMSR